ncbi:MAG: hypothetical protein E2601_06280 [Microbacterium sp.]|nr:hypothetical protein [Microbacterium sp.]
MTAKEATDLLVSGEAGASTSSHQSAAAVAELCARIPLALHLASSLSAMNPQWGLAGVETELRRRHGVLGSLALGDRALRATFETAVAALPESAMLAFRSIAQIPGRLIAPEVLVVASELDPQATREALRVLREHGLTTPGSYVGDYRVHDLLYEYIEDLNRSSPLPNAGARRIAVLNWFIVEAAENGLNLQPETDVRKAPEALAWFDRFAGSMMIGLLHAAEKLKQYDAAVLAAAPLGIYYMMEYRWAELSKIARCTRRWLTLAGPATQIPKDHQGRRSPPHPRPWRQAVTEDEELNPLGSDPRLLLHRGKHGKHGAHPVFDGGHIQPSIRSRQQHHRHARMQYGTPC